MDRNLQTWTEDQLHALLGATTGLPAQLWLTCELTQAAESELTHQDTPWRAGMAEGVLVKYIISLARKASNSSLLASQLQSQVRPPA